MNKIPNPYIQNHINWCWATAAKIVGLHYCKDNHHEPSHQWQKIYPNGVPRNDLTGLVNHHAGSEFGEIRVDAWQYYIVENAKDNFKNPDGNNFEYDYAKVKALKYIVTGNVDSTLLIIKEYGYHDDEISLLKQGCWHDMQRALDNNLAMIGNFIGSMGYAHSVVLFPHKEKTIKLYDPKDGFIDTYTYEQIFETGFLTNNQNGVIKWVQYIDK